MEQPNAAVLMFIAARQMETRVLEHLAQNDLAIPPAQGRVAARIHDDGIRLTELAQAAGVTKQTAGVLIDSLQKAGYVERRRDPTDARARLIFLSEKGRRAQRVAREMERTVEAEWAEHLGPEAMTALRDGLVRLREITDPYLPTVEQPGDR